MEAQGGKSWAWGSATNSPPWSFKLGSTHHMRLSIRSCTGIENLKVLPPKLDWFDVVNSIDFDWQCFKSNSSVSMLHIALHKEVRTVYEKGKHFNLMTLLASLPRLGTLWLDGYSLKVSVSTNEAIGVVNYMEAEGNSDLKLNRLQTVILHYFNGLKAEVGRWLRDLVHQVSHLGLPMQV
ncbi:hypothetical protein LguiB_001729 [Lonicera macranthoides]